MSEFIKIHPADNVAVAIHDVEVGGCFDIDGVKIDFAEGWVHLRKSNTEPIIRVYSEAATMDKADALAQQVMAIINE